MRTENNPRNLNVGILIIIILYGLALYHVPLHSTFFCLDDSIAIVNNGTIKQIDIPKIFNAFNTRFLAGLSFALNYRWSGLNPGGWRLINLLIHCLNAFLVYLLIKSTLYVYAARKRILFYPLEWPAFLGSMLFLCHPIQTEPVNFITQRFVLMATFFYLASLCLYVKSRLMQNSVIASEAKPRHGGATSPTAPRHDRRRKFYYLCSLITAIAAMLCKEFVVTLPFMIALYEFCFLNFLHETIGQRWKRLTPFFVIALIVPILLLRTPPEAISVANIADSDLIQEGGPQKVRSHIDITRALQGISRKSYFLTELNVVCTYVRLLFLPVNQNFDYDYPLSHTMDAKTLMSGVFLLFLLALAAVVYKSYRIVSFSILWFFIALSVESSFIPLGHVIAEYRLYLASVGFVFLIMMLIYMKQEDQKKLYMMVAAVLVGFSILTYQRNKIWKDDFSLWDDTVSQSPHKARPYNDRGWAYYNRGQFTQAMSDYNKAIEIDPNFAIAYNNRGWAYYNQGQLTLAISDYNKTIEIAPDFAKAYYNRALVYAKQKNFNQAIVDFSKAIAINPNHEDTYCNRGLAYNNQGRFSQAISDYNKAIDIDPSYAEAYLNRGWAYYNQGEPTQAVSDYNKAIEIRPNLTTAYLDRGMAYNNQGQFTVAISDYDKAIEMDPRYAAAYINRAVVYYELGQYDKAWGDVHKAEELGAIVNPGFVSALKKVWGHNAAFTKE